MGLVDVEHDALVGAAQVDESVDVGTVAIHGVDALHHDEDAVGLVGGHLGHDAFQPVEIVVRETCEAGAAQTYAVDNRRVDKLVGHYQRALVGDGLDDASVGVIAAVEEQGRARVGLGECRLKIGIFLLA